MLDFSTVNKIKRRLTVQFVTWGNCTSSIQPPQGWNQHVLLWTTSPNHNVTHPSESKKVRRHTMENTKAESRFSVLGALTVLPTRLRRTMHSTQCNDTRTSELRLGSEGLTGRTADRSTDMLPEWSDNWLIDRIKTKHRGLSPRANYTDRVTAACRRS
jgi:hypothetical protein